MVSVCLPFDALLQHLPSYLGFSYLGCGVSLQGCCSKAQPLLLTLDEEYLLTAAVPDLQHGIVPLALPVPAQPPLFQLLLMATGPGLGYGWLLPATSLSCLILCNPMGCSPPGSSVHGIPQARVLEWAAISFCRGSSGSRDGARVSCTAGSSASRFFTSHRGGA